MISIRAFLGWWMDRSLNASSFTKAGLGLIYSFLLSQYYLRPSFFLRTPTSPPSLFHPPFAASAHNSHSLKYTLLPLWLTTAPATATVVNRKAITLLTIQTLRSIPYQTRSIRAIPPTSSKLLPLADIASNLLQPPGRSIQRTTSHSPRHPPLPPTT